MERALDSVLARHKESNCKYATRHHKTQSTFGQGPQKEPGRAYWAVAHSRSKVTLPLLFWAFRDTVTGCRPTGMAGAVHSTRVELMTLG